MIRFHYMRQQPVAGLNQWFRFYRPFTGWGIGLVIFRRELSLVLSSATEGEPE